MPFVASPVRLQPVLHRLRGAECDGDIKAPGGFQKSKRDARPQAHVSMDDRYAQSSTSGDPRMKAKANRSSTSVPISVSGSVSPERPVLSR